ncbi:MAG: hypothetical protein SOT28_01595 [Fusicatenibacter sp.]|nr:hypothetical protein [Lachnospiraceae bacterium]MDY2937001.1 hypothetical protein [Fusicatenibacter sp.]
MVKDITEKLKFGENPSIKIKGEEYEVNADAETVLKIMGKLGNEDGTTPKSLNEMYEMMFSEKDRKKIGKLKLKFNDFRTLIEAAIDLICDTGEEENSVGE